MQKRKSFSLIPLYVDIPIFPPSFVEEAVFCPMCFGICSKSGGCVCIGLIYVSFKNKKKILIVYGYNECVNLVVCVPWAHVWRSEDNFQELVLIYYLV